MHIPVFCAAAEFGPLAGACRPLGAGGIKLGDHQTDLKLMVPGLQEGLTDLKVTNTCLSENDGHQSLFYMKKNGLTDKAIMSHHSGFEAGFHLRAAEVEKIKVTAGFSDLLYWGLVLLLVPVVLIISRFRKREISY